MVKYILAFLLPVLCLTVPAMAQDNQQGPRLTEKAIDDFYATSATANQLDQKSYLNWIDQSMAPGLISTSETTLTIPGQPPVVHNESMDKAKFMQNAADTYESMRPARLTHYVVSMDIAVDGRSAHIVDQTTFKGIVMGAVTADGTGTCEDDLAMSRTGTPQIVRSHCKLKVTINPPQK